MIDSHCHLDHEPLKSNLGEVIDRSKKIGIEKLSNEVEIVSNFSIPASFDLCITLVKSLNNGS